MAEAPKLCNSAKEESVEVDLTDPSPPTLEAHIGPRRRPTLIRLIRPTPAVGEPTRPQNADWEGGTTLDQVITSLDRTASELLRRVSQEDRGPSTSVLQVRDTTRAEWLRTAEATCTLALWVIEESNKSGRPSLVVGNLRRSTARLKQASIALSFSG